MSGISDVPRGLNDDMSAAAPLTNGALNEVPDATAYPPPSAVEITEVPGAETDTDRP
jgi:hypothetical protein